MENKRISEIMISNKTFGKIFWYLLILNRDHKFRIENWPGWLNAENFTYPTSFA